MEELNNNGIIENPGKQGKTEEKGLLRKAADNIERGWMRFSTSKGGRWAIRGAKVALIGLGLKTAYDKGKASVKPTTIYVTPMEEGEPTTDENQEETKPVEAEEQTAD